MRPRRPAVKLNAMFGLYALKPWYASRLRPLRRALVVHGVSPHVITAAGVASGAAAGIAFFVVRPGAVATVLVAFLLAIRLACANLDGGVAREGQRGTRFGVVVNEIGDRLADIAAIAGLFAIAPAPLVVAAMLAASMPSWVSLAGTAAGAPRVQGGPVGKTERCVVLVAIAATGWTVPLLTVLIIGSALTAALRLGRLRTMVATS
jgi:CDP-diacylglycerol---glycerol-3-phosphate 3-phosphatidyltransferase